MQLQHKLFETLFEFAFTICIALSKSLRAYAERLATDYHLVTVTVS